MLFLITVPNFAQELRVSDFLEFKDMKFGYIEEFLILNGWDFKGSETNRRQPGDPDDHPYTPGTRYSAVVYEYLDNNNQKVVLTVTEYDDQEGKEIRLFSESRTLYEDLLLGFVGLNFSKSGEKEVILNDTVVEEVEPGQRIILKTIPELYKKGRLKLNAMIKEYAVIDAVNEQDGSYTYRPGTKTEEYMLVF